MFRPVKEKAAGKVPVVPASISSVPSAEKPRPSVWDRNGGIYLGYQCEAPADKDRPLAGEWASTGSEHAYRGEGHVTTIGPPGSGKTRTLLLTNLHRLLDWSIVIVDTKGTACAHTAVHRARREGGKVIGDNIIVIDPFSVMSKNYPRLVEKYPFLKSRGNNPVAAMRPENPAFVDQAKRLAEALVKVDSKGEKHWAQSGQAFTKGALMGMRLQAGEAASLHDFRTVIGLPAAPDPKDEEAASLAQFCAAMVKRWGPIHPAVAATLSRFCKISPDNRELVSVLSTVQTQTDWLDSPAICDDLRGATFPFETLKSESKTVYLILPPEYLASHATWLRLMITSILVPLLRNVEDSKVPVLFMLDEFAQLGHMEIIQDNISLMREYGVKLWTIWQGLAQAKRIYDEGFEDFVATSGVLQTFAARDVTTRDYLSKISGQRLYWLRTRSENTSRNTGNEAGRTFGENEGLAHMQGPVFWPHDLGAIGTGQAVLYALEKGAAVRSILPQPEKLAGVVDMMTAARRDIEGR